MIKEQLLAIIQNTKGKNKSRLDLSQQGITELPSEIGQLPVLRVLHLSGNQLRCLPPEISQLFALQWLDLSNNQLNSLPTETEQLFSLQLLNLSNNQLRSFPTEIEALQNLRVLDMRHNPCYLPDFIGKFQKQGTGIYIPQNSHDLPEEFLDKKSLDIYRYLTCGKGELRPINEAKLILVGGHAVGKTCLVNRLLHDIFVNPSKTKGIAKHQWSELTIKEHTIHLNVWDFGDQEMLHSIHQFFFTQRSVYILVLNVQHNEEESRLEYWLKLIQSFSGESPILIVGNKIDEEHHLTINERFLIEKYYPIIKGFYLTSCVTGQGIDELKQGIKNTISELPHIHDLIPVSWFDLKKSLEHFSPNYMSYQAYQDLCVQHNITESGSQSTLCGFLHDLGIMLNFRNDERFNQLLETHLLNPEWVTNAAYNLLNYNELFKNHGIFTATDLAHILDKKDYPTIKEYQFIIEMMEKFELCFPIENTQSYLIPELLKDEEPDLGWEEPDLIINKEGNLRFEYHYDVLPHSVFSRFMVRLYKNISKKTYWRTGVVLTYENNKALIKADIEDKKISILVTGNPATNMALLNIIRKEFKHIHTTIKGLEVKEKFPYKTVSIDYQYLRTLEKKGIKEFIPEGLDESVCVEKFLGNPQEKDKKSIENNRLSSFNYIKIAKIVFNIFIMMISILSVVSITGGFITIILNLLSPSDVNLLGLKVNAGNAGVAITIFGLIMAYFVVEEFLQIIRGLLDFFKKNE